MKTYENFVKGMCNTILVQEYKAIIIELEKVDIEPLEEIVLRNQLGLCENEILNRMNTE
jgi:hypothetical protein